MTDEAGDFIRDRFTKHEIDSFRISLKAVVLNSKGRERQLKGVYRGKRDVNE